MELGQKLKAIRRSKSITLQQVAMETGLSKSFLSQVETGAANPSIGSLKKITNVLGIPLVDLFDTDDVGADEPRAVAALPGPDLTTDVRVVRRDRRKMLVQPGSKARMSLLTPDLQRKLEVILGEEEPGDGDDEWYSHTGEEFGLVLEGRYEVSVGQQVFVLEAGDSIYYSSHLPHKMRAIGDRPAKTLWVITPPSF